MRTLISLIAVTFLGLVMYSCTEQNPVYTKTTTDASGQPGNLEVFVRLDLPTGPFCSSANVYVYLSEQDRTNDMWYKFNITDPDQPQLKGALFNSLPYQLYYLKAMWRSSPSVPWKIGVDQTYVPLASTKSLHITVTD